VIVSISFEEICSEQALLIDMCRLFTHCATTATAAGCNYAPTVNESRDMPLARYDPLVVLRLNLDWSPSLDQQAIRRGLRRKTSPQWPSEIARQWFRGHIMFCGILTSCRHRAASRSV